MTDVSAKLSQRTVSYPIVEQILEIMLVPAMVEAIRTTVIFSEADEVLIDILATEFANGDEERKVAVWIIAGHLATEIARDAAVFQSN